MCRIALSVINLLEFHDLLNDFKDNYNCSYAEEQSSPLDTNNGIIWYESKFGTYYEEIYNDNIQKHPIFGYRRYVYFKSFNYFKNALSNKTLNN